MAHLTLLQAMEAGHVIATQRDQAITERDHAQEQADEWERSARLSAAAAVGWQSKHQALEERVRVIAAELAVEVGELPQEDGRVIVTADWLLGIARRLRGPDSLPSDGEVVRTEETVPTAGRL